MHPAYHKFAFNRLGLSRDAGTTKRGWASTEGRYGGLAREWVMNGVEECDRTEGRSSNRQRQIVACSVLVHSLAGASPTSPEQAEQHHRPRARHQRRRCRDSHPPCPDEPRRARQSRERICRGSHWAIMVKLAIPEQQTPPPSTLGPGTLPRVDL